MNLTDLRALGVEVSLSAEGKVRLRAAPGVLTEQLRQAIVEAKPRLLDELRGLRQAPVNVVNMVNFDAYCLTAARAPSVANGKVHPRSNPQTVTALDRPSGSLSGALGREAEAAVLAWLDHIGETDPATIGEALTACRRDDEARRYFLERAAAELTHPDTLRDGRRTCSQCGYLRSDVCVVAKPDGQVSAICGYRPATSLRQR